MAFFDRVIREHFDRQFFLNVAEAIDGAFASAHHRAALEGRALRSQQAYARGTDRYFAVQAAVMNTALECGAEDVTARAGNFPMPVARHRRFLVTASITDSLEHLRRSRARRLLAGLNGILDPHQPDFWRSEAPLTDGKYFGMLLIAKGAGAPQELPLGVFFGVPSSSFKSWHFYEEVGRVAELYGDTPSALHPTRVPTLRSVPRSIVRKIRKTD